MKPCIKCKKCKPVTEFYRCKVTISGFEGACKQCKKDARKVYGVISNAKYYIKIRKTEHQRERQRNNMRKKLLITQNHISHRMSNQIYKVLGKKKNKIHWESLVGYTATKLREHFESLFTEGMSWTNYGKWEIDHIIPKSFFVFDSPKDVEFKMCWRLENLQPLWAKDNLRKSNKLSLIG